MDVRDIIGEIDESLESKSLPKRTKTVLQRVRDDLSNDDAEIAVKITTAIYELEDVANDVNIPMHTKTILWDIISNLESLKE